MTLPDERYRAVKWAGEFLQSLMDPKATPKVPKHIRAQARSILRHYPTQWDMQRVVQVAPEVFQERMEELHRFIVSGTRDKDK